MKKLKIIVCENYLPEFRAVIGEEQADDVELVSFPSFCDGKITPEEITALPVFSNSPDTDTALICSEFCRAPRETSKANLNSLSKTGWFKAYESPYCYSQLISNQFSQFFIAEGYNIVTTGWLSSWESHLKRQGFSRETARSFYQEWCRKLIFLDPGIDKQANKNLECLSDYLQIPSKTIPISLDPLRALVKEILSEWRLKNAFSETDRGEQIRDLQEKNAKNAMVLNIMSKIAVAEYKRDVISMLEEIWLLVFGAAKTRFWSRITEETAVPDYIQSLEFTGDQIIIVDEEKQTVYALLESGGKVFGILEAGGFLFPQNLGKYTELFDSMIKIAALAVSNAQRYEDLTASRNQYEYSSYHDGLTGLYNRSFYKQLTVKLSPFHPGGVFAVDVDNLKIVNDTLGHSQGDILIQTAAEVLKNTFRKSDFVIRMGGDEFTVIVPHGDNALMNTLCARLKNNIGKILTNEAPKLSLSFGYAVTATPEDTLEKTVHQADFRMYQDKRGKKESPSDPSE